MEPIDSKVSHDADSALGPVTSAMVQSLRETRPWVLLIAILGFIGSGLLTVVGLFMGVAGGLAPDLGVAGAIGLATVYLVGALIYAALSYYLYRYATSIRELTQSGSGAAMERALASQKAFWRLVGIMTVAYIGILALMLLGALVVGLFASMG